MKVYKVSPRGYCKGVVNAINIAKKCAKEYANQPITILGMIVHNQYIVDALANLGIKTIDHKGKTRLELLDEIHEGVVIITAHGASDEVSIKASKKGLIVVDASCKDVIKTHELIKDHLQNNKEVLYIGKAGHPESEASISISNHVHLIEKKEDIDQYISSTSHFVITNQTTMSLIDVEDICQYAKEKLHHVTIEKEICNATTIRQQAMLDLPEDVDLLYVIGDPRSNNSTKLRDIALKSHSIEAYMIASVEGIELTQLKGKKYVAVTSGASTPTSLTNQVIQFLEQYEELDESTHKLPTIDPTAILN